MASISVGESSTTMTDSSVATVSLKRVTCSTPSKENVGRDEIAIPYDVGGPWLEPTSPSPSEDDADGHSIHGEIQVVPGVNAKINEPSSGRLPGVHGVFPYSHPR